MTTIGNSLTTYKRILTPAITEETNAKQANGNATNPCIKTQKTDETNKPKETKRRKINAEELYDKYQDNPSAILKELGITSNSTELKEMLKDKESLKVLLTIAEKENLTSDDLSAAFQTIMSQKSSGIFTRAIFWLTNGFKTEKEVNAENLSQNMNEIREIRGKDFSTEITIKISFYIADDENKKANAMHFVEKKGTNGFLYSDENVLKSLVYLAEKPENAESFMGNVTHLESITDEKGANKYNGDTNISVAKRMTQNPDLAQTMKKVAHKKDMTNEYLENITRNLEKTPDMQGSIEYSLSTKNEDGSDRFSANSINTESNQLVNQSKEFCKNYEANLKEISQYKNLTSEDVVSISESITKKPEIANEIISKIESGNMTGEEIAKYAQEVEITKNTKEYETTNELVTNSNNTEKTINNEQKQVEQKQVEENHEKKIIGENKTQTNNATKLFNINNNENKSENEAPQKTEIEEKPITIPGVTYDVTKLETKFGASMAEQIINALLKDPQKLETIKQYENNPTILMAYLEDDRFFNKVKKSLVTNGQLEDIVSVCTDASSKALMLLALEQGSVSYALQTVRYAKITNSKDDAQEILSDKTLCAERKKQQISKLYGINENKEYCA